LKDGSPVRQREGKKLSLKGRRAKRDTSSSASLKDEKTHHVQKWGVNAFPKGGCRGWYGLEKKRGREVQQQ